MKKKKGKDRGKSDSLGLPYICLPMSCWSESKPPPNPNGIGGMRSSCLYERSQHFQPCKNAVDMCMKLAGA